MKKTQGLFIQFIDGVHTGKKGYAYYVDQTKELHEAKKVMVTIEGKKTLTSPEKIKVIGYCD